MADQTDSTAPIGRISWQDAMPGMNTPAPEQADTKPLPTLNPADSPYTPLNLPEVTPRQVPIQEETPVDNLGAVSRGGAIAYMADKILRGVMQGYDFAQQRKADQFNKKLKAQEDIYHQQADQFNALSKAGYGPVLKDPSQISSPGFTQTPEFQAASPEWKAAYNRLFAANQAIMQTIGSRIPQPKQSKKSKQGQANGQDQSNLLQRFLNHQKDPQDALQAVYTAKMNMPPTPFIEMMPYFTAQYHQQVGQKAQTAASAQTGQLATTEAATAKAQNEERLQQLLAQAPPADPTAAKAREDEISRLQEALAPPQKTFTAAETTRYRTDPQGNEIQYQIDPYTGEEVQGTEKIVKTAASVASKGWKVTGQIATNLDNGKQFVLGSPEANADPFLKAVKAAIDASKDVTTTGTRTIQVPFGNQIHLVQVENTSTRHVGGAGEGQGTTETPKTAPNATGGQETPPRKSAISHQSGIIDLGAAGYKFSPETTTLLKNTGLANTAYQGAVAAYGEAKREASIAKTPSGGVARMNLLALYLKSLGEHTAGVSGSQVRLTNVEWQNAIQSAPILQRMAAKFGVNSSGGVTYLSGITLSPEQIDSLVAEMGRKALTAGDTLQSLRKQAQASQQRDAGVIGSTPSQSAASSNLPEAARAQLKEGHITTFANGQKWTLKDGQPEQVQ